MLGLHGQIARLQQDVETLQMRAKIVGPEGAGQALGFLEEAAEALSRAKAEVGSVFVERGYYDAYLGAR